MGQWKDTHFFFLSITLIAHRKRNSNDIIFYPSLLIDWTHSGDFSALCVYETFLQALENSSEWFSTGVRPDFLSCDIQQHMRKTCQVTPLGAHLASCRAVTVRANYQAHSVVIFIRLQVFILVTAGWLDSVHSATVFFIFLENSYSSSEGKIFFYHLNRCHKKCLMYWGKWHESI